MDKRERVARAIAEKALPTTDKEPNEVHYAIADAAIAALEPVTVQEAARVLLGNDCKSLMLESLDPYNNDAEVWEDVKSALRALAERGE